MRPVLVIEHNAGDGPAHFGEWLAGTGRPMRLVRTHAGEAIPGDPGDFAGICVLGGPMSANDDLPYLEDEVTLMQRAVARDVPVIGHCLGAQLLARSLGASIGMSPQPEIGWHRLTVRDTRAAREWFGEARQPWVLQWHREAFDLPAGAIPLASTEGCPWQAFVWRDRHLAMQFHPEADEAKVEHWLAKQAARQATRAAAREAAEGASPSPSSGHPPGIHPPERIRADTARHLAPMRALAFVLYRRWGQGLRD